MFVQHTCRLGCVLSLARIARTGTSRPETIDSIVVRFVLQTRKKHHKSREGFFCNVVVEGAIYDEELLLASLSEKLFINPQEAFLKIASVEINRMEWRD